MRLKPFITLLFCLQTALLFSQWSDPDQHLLLAKHGIKECREYRQVIQNGQPSGDSTLTKTSRYNPNGYVVRHTLHNTRGDTPLKFEHEYLYDSIEIKLTGYKSNGTAYLWEEYQYDQWNKRIRTTHTSTAREDGKLEQFGDSTVYDDSHRISAVYYFNDLVSGHDFKLLTRFEYPTERTVQTIHFYGIKDKKKPRISEIEYDSKGRIIRYYDVLKGKKRLLTSCIYNDKDQLVARNTTPIQKRKRYFGVISFTTKKKVESRKEYVYDEKGLVERADSYLNGKLTSRFTYVYFTE